MNFEISLVRINIQCGITSHADRFIIHTMYGWKDDVTYNKITASNNSINHFLTSNYGYKHYQEEIDYWLIGNLFK